MNGETKAKIAEAVDFLCGRCGAMYLRNGEFVGEICDTCPLRYHFTDKSPIPVERLEEVAELVRSMDK